ncbi:unnamed protein product, partial [Urochloa humidicola]
EKGSDGRAWTHLIPSPFSCSAHRRRRRILASPSQLSAYFYDRRCLRAVVPLPPPVSPTRTSRLSCISGPHLPALHQLPAEGRLFSFTPRSCTVAVAQSLEAKLKEAKKRFGAAFDRMNFSASPITTREDIAVFAWDPWPLLASAPGLSSFLPSPYEAVRAGAAAHRHRH